MELTSLKALWSVKMDVCVYNQTGYCKFGERCNRVHIKEICQRGEECADPECCKRHPRRCRYFYNYGKCKLGEKCAYRHDEETKESKIKTLEMEVKHLKEEMNNLKSEMNKIVEMLEVEKEVDIHGKKDGKELIKEKNHEKETVEENNDSSKESEIKSKNVAKEVVKMKDNVWYVGIVCLVQV